MQYNSGSTHRLFYFPYFKGDSSKLHALEVDFLNDPANTHLFDDTKDNEQPPPKKKKRVREDECNKDTNGKTELGKKRRKKKDPEQVQLCFSRSRFIDKPLQLSP